MIVAINLIKSSIIKTASGSGDIKKSFSNNINNNKNDDGKNNNLAQQKVLNFKNSSLGSLGSVLTPQTDANAEEKTKQLSKAIIETAAVFLSLIFPKALVVSSISKTSTGSMLIKNIKGATATSNNNLNENNFNSNQNYQRQMKIN